MSKFGILGRAVGSLFSLIFRLTYSLATYTSLFASLGLTAYTVGEMTMWTLKDQKQVLDILHWRDPKKSAVALAASMLVLILVAKFSFISLLAWTSLLVLAGTVGFRVFKAVEGQVKKTDGSNPFKPYLEPEITVPQEKVHAQADVLVQHGQNWAIQLRRLFLVENLFDSVKFGVLLWTLTYVGAWFSGVTLLTLFVLGMFTMPKVYEMNKDVIDQYIGLARQNVDKVHNMVQEKVPYLKTAEKEEKKE